MTKIISLRPDAQVSPGTPGFVAVCAVLLSEHLTPGRIASLGTKTELTLKPGVIYKAYTGICFDTHVALSDLVVRASPEAWRAGLYPLRVDYSGTNGRDEPAELLVYFTVAAGMEFVRRDPLFEMALRSASTPEEVPTEVSGQTASHVVPEGLAIATTGERHLQGPPAAPVNSSAPTTANAEALVKEWLNSPDDRGRVVDTPDLSTREIKTSAKVQGVLLPGAGEDQRVSTADLGVDASSAAQDPRIEAQQNRLSSDAPAPELLQEDPLLASAEPAVDLTGPAPSERVSAFMAMPARSAPGTKGVDSPSQAPNAQDSGFVLDV